MARLPQPGGDVNVWGDILNDYLRYQHNTDGSHNVGAILQVPPQSGRALITNPVQASGIEWRPLTKADVSLGNVDNTSDLAKPISTAQQAALNTKIAKQDAIALAVAL